MPFLLPVSVAPTPPSAAPVSQASGGGSNDASNAGSRASQTPAEPSAKVQGKAPSPASAKQDPASAQQPIFVRMLKAELGVLDAGLSNLAGSAQTLALQQGDVLSHTAKDSDAPSAGSGADPLPNPALLLAQLLIPVIPTTALMAHAGTGDQEGRPLQAGATMALNMVATPVMAAGEHEPVEALKAVQHIPLIQPEEDAHQGGGLFQALTQDDQGGLQKLPPMTLPLLSNLPPAEALSESHMAQPAPSATPSFILQQPIGTPGWAKALGEHVMGMVMLKAETAHIQLNPPELGPIDVTLKLDAQHNAQLTFNADFAATRAALQDSLPRLQSMMAASGIQLGDAQVFGGQSQQQQQNPRHGSNRDQQPPAEGEEFDTLASIQAARGVLSIFA